MIGGTFRCKRNVLPKDHYGQREEKERRRCRTDEKAAKGKSEEKNPPCTDSWSKRFDDCRINAEIGVFLEGAQPHRCRYEEQQNNTEKANGRGIHWDRVHTNAVLILPKFACLGYGHPRKRAISLLSSGLPLSRE